MKANELMIGDWVVLVDPDTKKREITRVHFGDLSCGFTLGLFEPIPITPEILEKNGMKPFDIDKLTDKGTAKWWHKNGDFFIKQYHFKHQNFKPTYSFGCHNHTLIEGIEYIHELQHALKLCRIEKEIEL